VTAVDPGPSPDEADRLIHAAWDVLGRTGFEGFKVASVIRAAGSSTKAFYRHFASKDAMLLALLVDETERASARFAARMATTSSPTEAVEMWISTMIGAAGRPDLAARARLFASLSQVSSNFPDQVRRTRQPMLAPLLEALAAGRASGAMPLADPPADARLIMSLCGGVLRDLLDGTASGNVEDSIAETQSFVLRSLGARDRP
jgi:AcrR family transcriptional regulator